MNEENINVNELTISGTINSICESDFEKEYIKQNFFLGEIQNENSLWRNAKNFQ